MDHDGFIIILILTLIAADIVTGIVKAISTGSFSSAEMRGGLLRKSGTIFLLGLAYGIQYASGNLPELPDELAVVFNGVSLYIVLMETSSIIENILVINPDLGGDKIRGFFGLDHDHDHDKEEEICK